MSLEIVGSRWSFAVSGAVLDHFGDESDAVACGAKNSTIRVGNAGNGKQQILEFAGARARDFSSGYCAY